jgi:hypothetical protein
MRLLLQRLTLPHREAHHDIQSAWHYSAVHVVQAAFLPKHLGMYAQQDEVLASTTLRAHDEDYTTPTVKSLVSC